jgi:hypothetical protein
MRLACGLWSKITAIGEGKISGVDAVLEDLLPEFRKDMDDRTKGRGRRPPAW